MGAASRVCTSCDTPVPDDAAFCPTCGAATPTDLNVEFGEGFEERLRRALADRYRIERELGRGGMAEIYHGEHIRSRQETAIKILPPLLANQANFQKRFFREAQTIAALEHPHIVKLFDYGEHNHIYYIAMEYIPGMDLSAMIHREGKLDFELILKIITEIASALDYAHAQGVIHRDIKPSNIMLQPKNENNTFQFDAILADFGIAKIIAQHTQITKSGIVGTFDYISPEQIQASTDVDHRADIYSLGIVTYQMLTGQLPFPTGNPGATLIAHMQHPPPTPLTLRPDTPDTMVSAIFSALKKDPKDRFESAGGFATALKP